MYVFLLNPLSFERKMEQYEFTSLPEHRSRFIGICIRRLLFLEEKLRKEKFANSLFPEEGIVKKLLSEKGIEWTTSEVEETQGVLVLHVKNKHLLEQATEVLLKNNVCYFAKKKSLHVLLILPDELIENSEESFEQMKRRHREEICKIFLFAVKHIFHLVTRKPYGYYATKQGTVYCDENNKTSLRRLTFSSFEIRKSLPNCLNRSVFILRKMMIVGD